MRSLRRLESRRARSAIAGDSTSTFKVRVQRAVQCEVRGRRACTCKCECGPVFGATCGVQNLPCTIETAAGHLRACCFVSGDR